MWSRLRPISKVQSKISIILGFTRQTNCASMSQLTANTMNDATFKFIDYDCIGFDLDNTLARYKVGAMIEMEYSIMAKFLVDKKGYPESYLLKPFDHNFILRGLFVDSDNGNLLRIGSDGYILQASHGTKMMEDKEIRQYYPNRHWEPSDQFAKDPVSTWNGPFSDKMRTLLDYFDVGCSLIFARAVDAIDDSKGAKSDKYTIWPDLQESLIDMFDRHHFQTGAGTYFAEMKNHPDKYYYKCSQNLLKWLSNLHQRGIKLFLITGSHADFAAHTASSTLGPNWRDFFDIVICYAKKPGFFTMNRSFLKIENFTETEEITRLQPGGIYSQGNFETLRNYFRAHINKENPKFLYVGDNLVQDIFTPNRYCDCDTVAVCEELEAEGVHGHEQWHPDSQMLVSTIWGSYFQYMNDHTNWYDIMAKHSKLCVPSIEYVAELPIDHEFPCNRL